MRSSPDVPHTGLTSAEAAARLERDGPNEVRPADPTSAAEVLLRQVRNPMVALLSGAAALSVALGEVADAVAIAAILVLDVVVGFLQEYRAERAVHALRSLTAPRARVLRDGVGVVIPAAEVVVDDVLVLEAGDVVAADATLTTAHALETQEAPLTGESMPVSKHTEPAADDAPLAERHDRVFAGTSVVRGVGTARVHATGMRTEVGRVAELLATATEGATPLQTQLAAVSRALIGLCLGVVVLVAVAGLARGRPALEVLMGSVALAIAAVPEGLPALVTIALAVGVRRLAARHVLVRRLPAVETLGACSVVCTDKTGTLTTGVMSVREVFGPDPAAVVDAAAACVDAELGQDGGVGDPMELAILVEAARRGTERATIETERPRLDVRPFDPTTHWMGVRRADGRWYVKGAPERVLALASSRPDGIDEALVAFAQRGLRVLAVAVGDGADVGGLRVLGLLGLADPPRPAAVEAIAAARRGGIRTVMITGDHPVTARAIAEELGLLLPGDDPAELVHARATPEHKLRLVRALRDDGAIVAMTGDGINDAPALREADVGIAMGRAGTEVAREAADVVLADDDFASLIAGIREGRAVWTNLRKTLVYLLVGNATELLVMLGAAFAGLPLPLLPLQLLWVNLVTDGLPALALVLDPPEADVLDQPPRDASEPMLGRRQAAFVAAVALLEAAVVLGAFVVTLPAGEDVARSAAFTTLVFSELLRAFGARSGHHVLFEVGALSNARLVAVVATSIVLQAALPYVPWLGERLGVLPMSLADDAWMLGLALLPVSAIELGKLALRAWRRLGG